MQAHTHTHTHAHAHSHAHTHTHTHTHTHVCVFVPVCFCTCVSDLQSMLGLPTKMCFLSTIQNLVWRTPVVSCCMFTDRMLAPETQATNPVNTLRFPTAEQQSDMYLNSVGRSGPRESSE